MRFNIGRRRRSTRPLLTDGAYIWWTLCTGSIFERRLKMLVKQSSLNFYRKIQKIRLCLFEFLHQWELGGKIRSQIWNPGYQQPAAKFYQNAKMLKNRKARFLLNRTDRQINFEHFLTVVLPFLSEEGISHGNISKDNFSMLEPIHWWLILRWRWFLIQYTKLQHLLNRGHLTFHSQWLSKEQKILIRIFILSLSMILTEWSVGKVSLSLDNRKK